MSDSTKQRHWFTTIWLILVIISNLWLAILYFIGDNGQNLESSLRIGVGVLSIVKIISIILIFKWRKIGFYGYILASIIILGIVGLISGYAVPLTQFLVGASLLVIILQIKNKEGINAWELLT